MKLSCQTLDLALQCVAARSLLIKDQISKEKFYKPDDDFLSQLEQELHVVEASYNELFLARREL